MDIRDLIVEFEDIISEEQCSTLISWFHKNSNLHIDGRVQGGLSSSVKEEFKVATQAFPEPDGPISHLMTSIIFDVYGRYADIRPTPQSNICIRDYSVRVYPKNKGYFKPHIDQNAGGNVSRILAIIMYLNDVHIGGETEFPTHDIKVIPKRGKILVFPCSYLYLHQGNMPISNDKYIATAFINYMDLNTHQ